MKNEEILAGLEKIVESLGIELRYEKGDFAGGYCVLAERRMLFVPNGLNAAQKVKVLARELAQMNLENVFIIPALREVIGEAERIAVETNLIENISEESLN